MISSTLQVIVPIYQKHIDDMLENRMYEIEHSLYEKYEKRIVEVLRKEFTTPLIDVFGMNFNLTEKLIIIYIKIKHKKAINRVNELNSIKFIWE
jgi:hypothetical protein